MLSRFKMDKIKLKFIKVYRDAYGIFQGEIDNNLRTRNLMLTEKARNKMVFQL